MNLFDEDILRTKKKKEVNLVTIIWVAIAVLSVLCIITFVLIIYVKSTILKITVDGQNASDLEQILIIEENNKIYLPIKRMAEYLKYDAYNGDYITRSEDPTKCYIETGEELISFTLNSNVLTKLVEGQTMQVNIEEAVKEINGELCVTSQGAQDAFNIMFYYNTDKNQIEIQTLTYLYTRYSQYYQTQGYTAIENVSFANKTAILDGMLIVKSDNGYYGVITANGEVILETKYDDIQYLSKTHDFLVESNGKKGIISATKETKIKLMYDSIQAVTNKNDIFYIIEQSDLYGLLDVDGKTLIHPEYEQIGIDVTAYKQNGVTNGYILYNEIIPVKRNNKWAIFNSNGNRITDFIYDSFGCDVANNTASRQYGVIEVLDYNLIVVCEDGKYNFIHLDGERLFKNSILDSVYIVVSEGENNYYITYGETTKELLGFLQENGISKPTPIE